MPARDPSWPGRAGRFSPPALLRWLNALKRRRPPGKTQRKDGVPVEPNGPKTLSGGAAAPLEFDDRD